MTYTGRYGAMDTSNLTSAVSDAFGLSPERIGIWYLRRELLFLHNLQLQISIYNLQYALNLYYAERLLLLYQYMIALSSKSDDNT